MTDVFQMLQCWELAVGCGAVAGYTEIMMMMTNPFPVTDVLTVGRSGAAG